MYVIATAGHVDHGKSTLVRALTGMEPDRFAEERRRGLSIDLGYAWTRLATPAAVGDAADPVLAFVDVPGHERFIATMLAGLGPAPAVMFVVAADEGWRRQSSEHLAAVNALKLRHGLLVVTRSDLADPGPTLAEAADRLAASSLGPVPAIAVSGLHGTGLDGLRTELGRLVGTLPPPRTGGRVRLWVDRAFTIRGAGTVVTGTLGAGTLTVNDELELNGRPVRVRGLQSLGTARESVPAVARVAVNLRGIEVAAIHRGDALLTPAGWPVVDLLDVRLDALGSTTSVGSRADAAAGDLPAADLLPAELVVHLGTASVPVRVRPLGGPMARLTLARALPVEPGDRLVLRDPGRHAIAAGALVLDVDPPVLRRRGAAKDRADALATLQDADPSRKLAAQVRRRGAVRAAELALLGVPVGELGDVVRVGAWLVDPQRWKQWQEGLVGLVDDRARTDPLDPRVPVEQARRHVAIPDRDLVQPTATAAGLATADGRLSRPGGGGQGDGTPLDADLRRLEAALRQVPYAAPDRPELAAWGLGRRELAAAERLGRIIRLTEDVVVLPTGPASAMRILAGLPQPFTTSQARQALGLTRRVAIPLLEHLDRRGWTVRVDADHRRVRSTRPSS